MTASAFKSLSAPLSVDVAPLSQRDAFVASIRGSSALVLDSPHSGTQYPPDFGFACPLSLLRKAEDTHVEKLYSFAPAMGEHWVEAHFPRSYLDANRNTTELDVSLLDAPWPLPCVWPRAPMSRS